MTEDIWAQKPKIQELELWGGDGSPNYEAYDADEMDECLEKLRAQYDGLKGVVDGLVEMGVVSVYDDRHWSTDYAELKEKAVKYDELVYEHKDEVFLKEMVSHQRKQLVELKDKLEAVKNIINEFNDNSKEKGPIPAKGLSEAYEAFLKIEEILESKE